MNTHALLWFNAATMLIYAVGLFLLHLSYRRAQGVWWFSVSCLAGSLSSAFIAFHSAFTREVHLAAGMWMMCLSVGLRHVGFTEFLRAGRRHWFAQITLVALYGIFLLWYSVLHSSLEAGLAGLAGVLALQTLLSVDVLCRFGGEENRVLRITTASVISIISILRLIWTLVEFRENILGSVGGTVAHAQWPLNMLFAAATVFCFVGIFVSQMGFDLREIASTDALTGALNRRAMETQAAREMARCRRYGFPLSVIVLDLDHFKKLNDTHGHNAGDAALCMVVRDLQAALRGTDLLCRSGGEEFLILLPHTDHTTALNLAERLRKRVAQIVVPVEGSKVGITASLGVASWNGAAESWTSVVKRADAALYLAKNAGRNRVVTGESPANPASETSTQMA